MKPHRRGRPSVYSVSPRQFAIFNLHVHAANILHTSSVSPSLNGHEKLAQQVKHRTCNSSSCPEPSAQAFAARPRIVAPKRRSWNVTLTGCDAIVWNDVPPSCDSSIVPRLRDQAASEHKASSCEERDLAGENQCSDRANGTTVENEQERPTD